jgi:hypothetical protein
MQLKGSSRGTRVISQSSGCVGSVESESLFTQPFVIAAR